MTGGQTYEPDSNSTRRPRADRDARSLAGLEARTKWFLRNLGVDPEYDKEPSYAVHVPRFGLGDRSRLNDEEAPLSCLRTRRCSSPAIDEISQVGRRLGRET